LKKITQLLALFTGALLLAGCSNNAIISPSDSAPQRQIDIDAVADAVPQSEPYSKYGNPDSYEVNGRTYTTLKNSKGYVERGIASWYGTKFHGRRTSSGEPYNLYDMTAAHKTLPLPTYAQVTNLDNGRSVVVKINDRGPFHDGRIIDLSYVAAMKLGIAKTGTGRVELRAIDPDTPTAHLAQAEPPASTPEPAAMAVATPTASNQNLFLQVGAFSSFNNAESLRNRISNVAATPIVISKSDQPQPVYRVRIGPLSSDQEAQQLVQRLAPMGITQTSVVFD
jgi:rare lipoprotein A